MQTFSVSFPDAGDTDAMNSFQGMMDEINAANDRDIKAIADDFGIGQSQAADVWYLRSRSRHTPEKEAYLIWCFQNDEEAPFIMDDFEVPESFGKK